MKLTANTIPVPPKVIIIDAHTEKFGKEYITHVDFPDITNITDKNTSTITTDPTPVSAQDFTNLIARAYKLQPEDVERTYQRLLDSEMFNSPDWHNYLRRLHVRIQLRTGQPEPSRLFRVLQSLFN